MKNAGDKVGVTMAQIEALTKGRAGGLEGMATLVEAGLGGSTLTGAYASAKDLAAMMKTDIPAAAGMMATALEFPERAARTLREAHIRLSDTQQEAIETLMQFGDQAGAQAIILSAVAEKTDGAAAAMRGTLGGQMREFSATVEHLSEIFGKALAPSFEIIIALFKDLANWVGDNKSTILAWGDTAAGAFKAVTEPLRKLIALLRAGEMDSAFLYLQVGWSRTVDRLREGTEVVKTFFGHLGEFLLDLFESIALGIEARVKRIDQRRTVQGSRSRSRPGERPGVYLGRSAPRLFCRYDLRLDRPGFCADSGGPSGVRQEQGCSRPGRDKGRRSVH